jgi:hypothetical protein
LASIIDSEPHSRYGEGQRGERALHLQRQAIKTLAAVGQDPMATSSAARTYISYSRKDGPKFAADLRQRLLKENLSVWQDLVASFMTAWLIFCSMRP